ncbi:MAG: collagen-like protein [Salinimicrobium sp.]
MKKLFYLFSIISLSLASCSSGDEGPVGPPGPQGPPGADGLIGTVFDVTADFNAGNDYSALVTYSDFTDVEVFETDVVLVYLRVGQDGEAGGEPVYLWRLLPQTYYVDGGTMQYNYDYSYFDVNIFLNGDVELSGLGSVFLDDQVFRVAIVPADFAQTTGVNVADYNAVMSAMKVDTQDIPELELQ